jgi:hypothetical protein
MNSIAYVGMDVHLVEIRIAVVDGKSGELIAEELTRNTEDSVRKVMRRLRKRY